MAVETVLHSNAFNASGFVQNNVDPRTGQYALSINLPPLVGNDQVGPELPIRLVFNPFSDKNVGFGRGWYIDLTQYVPGTRMLRLHTGESFKVTGSGTEPGIKERKLESFRFFDDSVGNKQQFRVVHKSYMEEVLSVYGVGEHAVALPSEVRAASGHRILLSYTADNQRLERIVDGTGLELLKISYGSTVTLDLHPNANRGNKPLAQYKLILRNEALSQIDLPAEAGGNWRFEYATAFGLTCLAKVSTPYGSVEAIGYGENGDTGHLLPGGGTRTAIPRVTSHTVNPGAGQPSVKTTYTYTILQNGIQAPNNFVGNGSGVSWRDDGEDNLYRARSTYLYGSTAHQWGKGADGNDQVLRTTQRSYNRFHLQVSEVVLQGNNQLASSTTYHGDVATEFDNQPRNFQLPLEQARNWSILGDASKVRYEPATRTEYDLHGNLTAQTLPSGQCTVTEYYPAEGADGCPPDPDGFVRNMKSVTEYPASGGDQTAPVLRKRYEYQALARVSYPGASAKPLASDWLVSTQESLCEVVGGVEQAALRVTTMSPIDEPADLLRHGRPLLQSLLMGGKTTKTGFTYNKEALDGHPVLVTEQQMTGFDHGDVDPETGQPRHVCKVITLKDSMFIGQPLLNRDDNDVEIEYAYDALRRVVRETVSPNQTAYTASRVYEYGLVSAPGGKASQSRVDVKGVAIRSYIDGLGRVVSEERHDADAEDIRLHQVFRPRNAFTYDELGQLAEAIEYDWKGQQQMPLATRYEYDDWGQQRCETGPDGVKRFEEHDPIGSNPDGQGPEGNLPTQTSWSESADGKVSLGKTTTWLNLFEQPAQVQRFDLAGKPYAKHEYFYDGLGRNVREVDAGKAVTRSSYDAFGRLVDQTLADRSVVHRDYAVHSSEDLPTSIRVGGIVLGEQVFDGLNRLIISTTGGRVRRMYYEPGQSKPSKVKTAAGNVLEYRYIPQLGEDPEVRLIPGKQADYKFDPQNARLTWCKEEGEELTRAYFSTGEIKQESRTIDGETWAMEYGTSLLGRQLFYKDVLGQTQTYDYYASGLLEQTALGTTSSRFFYDGLSNTQCILTLDGTQGLATELEYDHQGRECLRRFVFLSTLVEAPIEGFAFANEAVQALVEEAGLRVQGVQELVQEYSVLDQITFKKLSENGSTLREETYKYDARARLEEYWCEGLLSHSPKDPAGKTIRYQYYEFDALDNITWVLTEFEEEDGSRGANEATYLFEYEDPAQLTGVRNTHADYADFTLDYDDDGNMKLDDKGKTLTYDALGRLSSYDGSGYSYDPLDRLAGQEV
ncbi:RHS repeat domain-containing protein [Pseudomonas putida]|uniref:RHS repeat domain-containing protein n=1 Tax=Pseudomonas putida TaxID=303 RepID=UPI002745AB89|nr:RHS repeat domain-containing protein [Pseudomonas putida]MDP9521741.1 RHS repeat domain-containing protein [Pseudomonas putida]